MWKIRWCLRKTQCSPTSLASSPHLRRHPADGWNVIASVDEVRGIKLQLELTQPLIDRLGALGPEGKRGEGIHRNIHSVLFLQRSPLEIYFALQQKHEYKDESK